MSCDSVTFSAIGRDHRAEMAAELSNEIPEPAIRVYGPVRESVEFRLSHYRVYDEDGFASSFSIEPPENATLASVSAQILMRFHGTGGTGYESKDLVILLGPRIMAVVRCGSDGDPVITRSAD